MPTSLQASNPPQNIELGTSRQPFLPTIGLIAVVGCDGTGKSTLTIDLVETLRRTLRVERRYLGLISGEDGDKIKRFPLIGIWLERRLAAKSQQAQDMRNKQPGTFAALVMYTLSLWRAARLRCAHRLARSGAVVITDRYPQAEISGFHYDGPGLGVERCGRGWRGWLAARELRMYQRMARYQPILVIRLGIDVETACARKPDHSLFELNEKIKVMARLQFSGAPIFELNSRAPYNEVLEQALRATKAAIAVRPT